MTNRVKVLTLHVDACIQCIRRRNGLVDTNGNTYSVCTAKPMDVRRFTKEEVAAFRSGELSLPDWCPLPDAGLAE
jgi:hypothetical protein